MSDLSILWPSEELSRREHSSGDSALSFSDTAFIEDLGLSELIRLRDGRTGATELNLASFLTCDPTTLRLRADMLMELLETPGLFDALKDSFTCLSDIFELQNARDSAMSDEQLLFSIREVEDYLDYLGKIKEIFTRFSIKSELLHRLWQTLEPLVSGEDYTALCAATKKQSHAIKHIRSVTVGVNLDPTLHPIEAGVLEINEQPFVSGEPISHLLRLNFKKDEYTCMAPLYPTARRLTPQEQAAMGDSLNAALRKVFGDSLKSWASLIKSHVLGNLHVLAPVVEEWRFILAATDTLRRLRALGMPLCVPTITDGGDEQMIGLYHPLLALGAMHPAAVVRNGLTFRQKERLYILTGPNSGGKSIYLQAAGLAYAMLHLGLPLPAESATVTPTDGIYTHFADIRDGSYRQGRLGAECEHIHAVNHRVSTQSLVLFDEALSGTNATEAVAISSEILAAYAEIGVRGIWVTHFHDLCRLPETVGGGLANLSARVSTASHDRLFIIERGDGEARSYAMDIARQFHLTREEILHTANQTE